MNEGRDNQGKWVQGVSGNPSGGRKLPADYVEMQKVEKEYLVRLAHDLKNKTESEINSLLNNPDEVSIVEKMIARAFQMAGYGNDRYTKLLLNYLIGPPPQTHQHTGKDGEPLGNVVVMLPRNGSEVDS